jgi:hypothetical protein
MSFQIHHAAQLFALEMKEVTETPSISSGQHTTEWPAPPSVAIYYILKEVGSEHGEVVYYSMSGTRWYKVLHLRTEAYQTSRNM